MNQIIHVNTLEKFHEHWNFLEEGYAVLVNPKAGGFVKLTRKDYQRMLLCAAVDDATGGVLVLASKRGVPLGFVCILNDSNFVHPQRAEMFAVYSNEKCPSTFEELSYEAQRWARRRNYTELTFNIHRITGAARTFVEKKLKLEPNHMQFRISL